MEGSAATMAKGSKKKEKENSASHGTIHWHTIGGV